MKDFAVIIFVLLLILAISIALDAMKGMQTLATEKDNADQNSAYMANNAANVMQGNANTPAKQQIIGVISVPRAGPASINRPQAIIFTEDAYFTSM